jgi:hypothetical protein
MLLLLLFLCRRVHTQFVVVSDLRQKYYAMGFEEQQQFLIRQLRDYMDPNDQKLRFYLEKVLCYRSVAHPAHVECCLSAFWGVLPIRLIWSVAHPALRECCLSGS